MAENDLRTLPAVDKLLKTPQAGTLVETVGRPLALEAIRTALDEVRTNAANLPALPGQDELLARAAQLAAAWTAPTLLPVINASGVIIHTNLGRSPLSPAAIQAMRAVAEGYSTLEYDLEKGVRGSRSTHAEALIRRLTGAEAAFVVNNNAAAVLLTLSALAARRRVVISRTQLVEIGGSFRIPDVMRQSGARLVEVGATNRVHLGDYEQALDEGGAALMMMAHWSNFKIVGFTSEPSTAELVALAQARGVPLVDDLGSGTFLDTARYGLAHETTVPETLQAGVDLVTFSGDKLLGGPQAGVIAGKASLVARIKKHPLARAVRPDKLCLAGLTATLLHYVKDEAEREIPIWRMISARTEDLKARAEAWAADLRPTFGEAAVQVLPGESTVGGGSLPGETLPTWLLGLAVRSPKVFFDRLRRQAMPVIVRTQDNLVLLDPRTVLPEQEPALLAGIVAARR